MSVENILSVFLMAIFEDELQFLETKTLINVSDITLIILHPCVRILGNYTLIKNVSSKKIVEAL